MTYRLQLMNDAETLIGTLIQKLGDVEMLNIQIDEQAQVIDILLAVPEKKDIH